MFPWFHWVWRRLKRLIWQSRFRWDTVSPPSSQNWRHSCEYPTHVWFLIRILSVNIMVRIPLYTWTKFMSSWSLDRWESQPTRRFWVWFLYVIPWRVLLGHANSHSEWFGPGAADGILQSALFPGPALLLASQNSGNSFPLVTRALHLIRYVRACLFVSSRIIDDVFRRYDSLTGVPSVQRALAFEKGSVLFNIGALHTQIGARQDRSTMTGVQNAIDAFQGAAGNDLISSCWCFMTLYWCCL